MPGKRATKARLDPDERLALAVHDLRGPLATVRLALKLLRDPDPAVVLDAKSIIERETMAMTRTLRSLADGARRRSRRA